MFSVTPDDTIDIHDFGLFSLWAAIPNSALLLDESILRSIQALNETKAQELEDYLYPACKLISSFVFEKKDIERERYAQMYKSIVRRDMRNDTDEEIRAWLQSFPISPQATTWASWDKKTAALVPWSTITTYWDDFWYPGADDLCLGFPQNQWRFFLYHEAIFLAGELKAA